MPSFLLPPSPFTRNTLNYKYITEIRSATPPAHPDPSHVVLPFSPSAPALRSVDTSTARLQIFSLTWSSKPQRRKASASYHHLLNKQSIPGEERAVPPRARSGDRCQKWQLCLAGAGRQLAGEATAEMTASLILSSTDVTEWPFPVGAAASLLYSIMAENKSLWVNLALFVILNDRNCHYACLLNTVASGGALCGKSTQLMGTPPRGTPTLPEWLKSLGNSSLGLMLACAPRALLAAARSPASPCKATDLLTSRLGPEGRNCSHMENLLCSSHSMDTVCSSQRERGNTLN